MSGVVAFLKMIHILFEPKVFEHSRFHFITTPPSKRQLFMYNLILFFVAIEALNFFWFQR
jgi:hypothetical protein